MHICYLCDEFLTTGHGGIGTMVHALGRGLVARGHSVTIVGMYHPQWLNTGGADGIEVVRVPHAQTRGAGFVVNGFRLRRALAALHKRHPIDVLEGPELGLAFVGRSMPYPTVIRMNGGHHFFAVTLGRRPQPWRSWLERRSFARATHLCAVSKFVATTTAKLLHLQHRDVEVLHNPVDISRFTPSSTAQEEDSLMLFAGTVCEKKGIRQLIEAMPLIVDAVPQARLVVCGRDTTDPETGGSFTERLRQMIPPAIASRVVFAGTIEHSQLPQMMAKAAVCVYPSHMEALPLAWLEGLAMGKAVVASSTGPGAEVIEQGVSGLLCDPYDPTSIAKTLITVLSDRGLRERLGREARRRAVTHFSLESIVQRNEAFYRRTCKSTLEPRPQVADPVVRLGSH